MYRIILHIAGINIQIQSEVNGIIGRFQEFYQHFITTNLVDIDYTIEIEQKKIAVSVDNENETFKFQGYAFRHSKKHALLLIPSLKNAYQYSEEFLLFIFSELCIEKNKLIFHSASLIDDQKNAYIFFGPSGIGKSTISKKLSDFTIFSDDMVVIEKTENGYLLEKTPFERDKQSKPSEKVLIKGFYRLVQGDALKTLLLTKSKAFNALLANLWFSKYQKEQVKRYTMILQGFIQDISVAELYVTKNSQKTEIIKCIHTL